MSKGSRTGLPLSDRAVVLLNPMARGGRAAGLAAPMQARLWALHPAVDFHVPASLAQAEDLVGGLPSGSRVVLIGGDGTLNRLLPALLAGHHRLGVVACGSGNDFARAHGLLARDWQHGLDRALVGQERPVDVGELRCGDRVVPFLSSLAAGFDAAVGMRALRGPGYLSGLPRYLWATLAEIAVLRRYRMRVAVEDGFSIDGELLFGSVLNTPSYGSGMRAVPHALTDDGALDLVVAGRLGRVGALLMLPRLLRATHLSHPEVATQAFSRMTASSDEAVPLAADGESIGSSNAWTVSVLPGRLRLLVPGAAMDGTLRPARARWPDNLR